jgi:hypothetical protein
LGGGGKTDVSANEYLEGGGIVGVRSDTGGSIGTIDNTWFAGWRVTAGTFIDGGGIVGATGSTGDYIATGITSIVDSVFYGNEIRAKNGQIMGGLVYSYGLAGGLTITDSIFSDNVFYSDVTSSYAGIQIGPKVYGAVTVDTGVVAPSGSHTLTLKATSTGSTQFMRNETYENGKLVRAHSLYFGTIPSLTGLKGNNSLRAEANTAQADAALIIDTHGVLLYGVLLYDPIWVNQDGGKTFNMTVQGGGDFFWNGVNTFTVGAPGTIKVNSGITTFMNDGLSDPFTLVAPDHSFSLAPEARINVMGRNTMTLAHADLQGTLFFNLYATTKDKSETALLTLHTSEAVNIDGSIIRLNNFGAGPIFQAGDSFYLIRTDGKDFLQGNPANNHAYARQGLLVGYNFIIDKKPYGMDEDGNQYLVARLEEQKAQVDPNPPVVYMSSPSVPSTPQESDPTTPPTPSPQPTPTPVPEGDPPAPPVPPELPVSPPVIPPVNPSGNTPVNPPPVNPSPVIPASGGMPPIGPALETTVLVGGRAAGLAFLAQRDGWLPDHSYQAADLALDENRSERAWVPFGGVDAARLHVKTGSHIKMTSSNMLLGLATRRRGDSGVFLFGAFMEAGHADYDTRNHFSGLLPEIRGDGKLCALGGGLMARHTWNNDFRIEASLRGGRLKNEFRAKNYEDPDTLAPASYKLHDRYLAAHLGVGHGWQISEKNKLDLLFRYYWSRQEGGNATLSNGERMRFEDDDSRRARVGGRWTHTWEENRFWYIGAAVEREFDSKAKASAYGFDFDAHDFEGTVAIGEIGVIIRSHKNSPFSLEAGLQGYTGKFKGVSGGVRIGWEF